jgi:ABC-type multidrug transport system ATPase subunit
MIDTLIYEDNSTPQSARNRLGAFKFTGDDVLKQVGQLSGGELSRLKMCMLMKDDINFLILDEPTNHLDIDSREWIEQAVEDFDGTLLFVSHDRYFIKRFATRIWELEGSCINDYRFGFEKYLQLKATQPKQEPAAKAAQAISEKPKSEKPKHRSVSNVEKRIARLEKEIAQLEKQSAEIDCQREEFASDYEKLMELDKLAQQISDQIDEKMEQWAELSE